MTPQDAAKKLGSRKKLAELAGVTYPQTFKWGNAIPEHRMAMLQVARPDLFPIPKQPKGAKT